MIQGANKSGSLIYDINECNAMATRLSVPKRDTAQKKARKYPGFF